MRVLRAITPFILACVVLALSAGCDETSTRVTPTAPSLQGDKEPAPRDFYPLSVGNGWTYDRKFTIDIEVIIGPPYREVKTYEGAVQRRIIGPEKIWGVDYLVEEATLTVPDRPDVVTRWTRFRQDHAGLYVADVPATDPPARVPATGSPNTARDASSIPSDEITGALGRETHAPESVPSIVERAWRNHMRRLSALHRLLEPGSTDSRAAPGRPGELLDGELLYLAYPLHPKSAWYNREEPFFVRSQVEAHEVLEVPAGRFSSYRLRVDNEFLDPEDYVLVWYGPCGRLAFSIHTETLAVDVETGETARITTDETERLRAVTLVDSRGCGGVRTGGGR